MATVAYQPVTERPRPVGWRFWIAWVLLTFASAFVYMILMIPVNVIMANRSPLDGAAGERSPILIGGVVLVASLLMGATFGAGQWLVMRKHIAQSGWWIVATAIGYGVPLTLGPAGIASQLPIRSPWLGMTLMIFEFGLFLGVLQWLVLRGRLEKAGLWIPITLAGWALAFILTGVFYITGLYVEPMDMLYAFLVPVAVSGAGMVWLLRRGSSGRVGAS